MLIEMTPLTIVAAIVTLIVISVIFVVNIRRELK